MVFAFGLLALSILLLWAPGAESATSFRRVLWFGVWAVSLAAARLSGVVGWIAVGASLGYAAIVYAFFRLNIKGAAKLGLGAVLVVFSAGLMVHRIPDFHPVRVIDAVRFSPDAAAFTLYLNYDKTLVGLFLLGWGLRRTVRMAEVRRWIQWAAPRAAGLILLVMTVSLSVRYVRFDPKLPRETELWLTVNLLSTCLAEEAFFRGFIQAQLQELWSRMRYGPLGALVVSGVFFGFAHAAGGPWYVMLAALAGLGYGWIYQRTQSIEASILTHFVLNVCHFFFFSYPVLATAIER